MKKQLCMLVVGLLATLVLVSCGAALGRENIPELLEISVGTLGDVAFVDGTYDNNGYNALLVKTFRDTTGADYDTLMEHYQAEATGMDDNGALLFDWGYLVVTRGNTTITINAFFT